MEIYSIFAQVYDKFMQAPYNNWADFIEDLWEKHSGVKPKLVLDLACGTGSMSQIFAKKGYETIGIDASPEMLTEARQKDDATLYLMQDMRSFELYGSVDAIICLCDSINYILSYEELVQIFTLCKNYLNSGGTLIFDINTEYKYSKILADNDFSH
ncbi:MAG: class I SAM-dependent methyltransferase, partial [Defluviitaleaceae bacterium]|nr:class I SAM-dependent methyltransferase [Defluviitaleaceae bacterium]